MPTKPINDEKLAHAKKVKAAHEQALMADPNVLSVGLGLRRHSENYNNDEICIVVRVKKMPDISNLPKELDGVPVDVEESGEITAL